jgi:NAD(P)-dependent dehydrogenase (short-subunit alcohol dehydrogenase family)
MPNECRVMLVTGGSRGIGAACALRGARAGYDVCVNYLASRSEAEAVVNECRAAGRRALAIQADVSDEAAVVSLFERAQASLGPLSCLVNNAGILAAQGPLASFSAARVRRVLEVNVLGAILCAREAVRRMSTRLGGSGGTIVNLSSGAAVLGSPNEYVDYAASKGAIDALTIGLSKEVGPEGIRVNAVRPGLIETEIHESGGERGRVARLASSIPLGRGGSADEVAAVVLWLASSEASFVTGSIVDCAGGR